MLYSLYFVKRNINVLRVCQDASKLFKRGHAKDRALVKLL